MKKRSDGTLGPVERSHGVDVVYVALNLRKVYSRHAPIAIGRLAQSVERGADNAEVMGSSPIPTKARDLFSFFKEKKL